MHRAESITGLERAIPLASGGRAASYLSFGALAHDHKKGLIGLSEAVRAAYQAQSQQGQDVFFDDVAGTQAVPLNTATIPTLERLAYHSWHTSVAESQALGHLIKWVTLSPRPLTERVLWVRRN
jgi:hypothetical protein